jgi:hypothetical protein
MGCRGQDDRGKKDSIALSGDRSLRFGFTSCSSYLVSISAAEPALDHLSRFGGSPEVSIDHHLYDHGAEAENWPLGKA